MKKSIFFEQKKPVTVWMLGTIFLLLAAWNSVKDSGPLNQSIILGLIALILLGYSISYEIAADYNNKKHFKMFGHSLFKSKLALVFPDYITVFLAKFKSEADWGPVGALGKHRNGESYVIRLFTGNKYFTVYKSNSKQLAKDKATQLSELLAIAIR